MVEQKDEDVYLRHILKTLNVKQGIYFYFTLQVAGEGLGAEN